MEHEIQYFFVFILSPKGVCLSHQTLRFAENDDIFHCVASAAERRAPYYHRINPDDVFLKKS